MKRSSFRICLFGKKLSTLIVISMMIIMLAGCSLPFVGGDDSDTGRVSRETNHERAERTERQNDEDDDDDDDDEERDNNEDSHDVSRDEDRDEDRHEDRHERTDERTDEHSDGLNHDSEETVEETPASSGMMEMTETQKNDFYRDYAGYWYSTSTVSDGSYLVLALFGDGSASIYLYGTSAGNQGNITKMCQDGDDIYIEFFSEGYYSAMDDCEYPDVTVNLTLHKDSDGNLTLVDNSFCSGHNIKLGYTDSYDELEYIFY